MAQNNSYHYDYSHSPSSQPDRPWYATLVKSRAPPSIPVEGSPKSKYEYSPGTAGFSPYGSPASRRDEQPELIYGNSSYMEASPAKASMQEPENVSDSDSAENVDDFSGVVVHEVVAKVEHVVGQISRLEQRYAFLQERNEVLTGRMMRLRENLKASSKLGNCDAALKRSHFEFWRYLVQDCRFENQMGNLKEAIEDCTKLSENLGAALVEEREKKKAFDRDFAQTQDQMRSVLGNCEQLGQSIVAQQDYYEKLKMRLQAAEEHIVWTHDQSHHVTNNLAGYHNQKREREEALRRAKKQEEKEQRLQERQQAAAALVGNPMQRSQQMHAEAQRAAMEARAVLQPQPRVPLSPQPQPQPQPMPPVSPQVQARLPGSPMMPPPAQFNFSPPPQGPHGHFNFPSSLEAAGDVNKRLTPKGSQRASVDSGPSENELAPSPKPVSSPSHAEQLSPLLPHRAVSPMGMRFRPANHLQVPTNVYAKGGAPHQVMLAMPPPMSPMHGVPPGTLSPMAPPPPPGSMGPMLPPGSMGHLPGSATTSFVQPPAAPLPGSLPGSAHNSFVQTGPMHPGSPVAPPSPMGSPAAPSPLMGPSSPMMGGHSSPMGAGGPPTILSMGSSPSLPMGAPPAMQVPQQPSANSSFAPLGQPAQGLNGEVLEQWWCVRKTGPQGEALVTPARPASQHGSRAPSQASP